MVSELTNIPRSQAKTINLALFYGMGKSRLADSLHLSKDATSSILTKYNQMVPFVKQLSRKVSQQAQDVGYIKTIEGRHSRFPTWEKKEFQPDKSKVAPPVSEDEAIKLYGRENIRRAFTYKALNKLIQGSAADMTKKAMVDLFKNGIVPLIQIHDELNISIPKDGEEKRKKDIIDIMEGTVKLNVPNLVDCECGESWGDVESNEED